MNERPFTAESPCTRPELAEFCARVKARVSEARFAHIVRVAVLAEEIALANGFAEGEVAGVRLAALLHDVAREYTPEQLFALVPPESALEREHPITLHGRAGRKVAENWGVRDERILEAIAGHTFGVTTDNKIGMALYIADVSEPGRGVNEGIRELAMRDLVRAYQQAVVSKVTYLNAKGKEVHPHTQLIYEQLSAP